MDERPYQLSIRQVGSTIVALGKNGTSTVAFCGWCEWSARDQTDEDLARKIADHMRATGHGQGT